jgi:hypothetical protein
MSSLLYSETVRRRLVRMLTGDVERPRPPVTLAGQRTSGAPPSDPSPLPAASPPVWTTAPYSRRDRAIAEPEAGDEQGPYSREQLIRMDCRFRAQLLRTFRDGLESRDSAAGLGVPPRGSNEPFRILAAHQRAVRYRDLAGVTAPLP